MFKWSKERDIEEALKRSDEEIRGLRKEVGQLRAMLKPMREEVDDLLSEVFEEDNKEEVNDNG